MLGTTVSAGGRLALRASSSRVLARASLKQQDRLVLFQLPSRQGVSNARNYWWSKPAVSEVVESSQHLEPAKFASSPEENAPPFEQIAETGSIDPVSPEVLPVDVPAGMSEVVTNVIPPLQYGDFAALGITSWWPSGMITWSFELLQVSTGMPWFYTIIAGTLFWRGILIPSTLSSLRNAARLSPYTEQIKALDEQAKETKDRAKQMALMLKKQKLIESAGVSMVSMILAPVIQLVGNFGLFFAMKGMVQLPVTQLTQSGVWFLPDLTLTGDYVLPTIILLVMNIQFSIMKKELDPTKQVMAHVMNVLRVASFASLPMMSWMPSGLWLSVLTGLVLSIGQSALLRVPRLRQALSIPPVHPMEPVTMRDTGRAILEWYRQRMMQAQVVDQRRPNWTTLPKGSRRRAGL